MSIQFNGLLSILSKKETILQKLPKTFKHTNKSLKPNQTSSLTVLIREYHIQNFYFWYSYNTIGISSL